MDASSGSEPGPSGSLARHEIKFITLLSLTEIGVGSVVHSLRLPLSGHFLSLNESLVLMQASRTIPPAQKSTWLRARVARSASNIALVSALLKSLSPAGKRLTPMLAILVQGLLFALGIVLGGVGNFGLALATSLSSVWAFAQPLLLAWLFVGGHFWDALTSVWVKIATPLGLSALSPVSMILVAVFLKALIAVALVFVSQAWSDRFSNALARRGAGALRSKKLSPATTLPQTPARGALRDLRSPLLLFSLGLSLLFAVYDSRADAVGMLWAALRPVALAFVAFYVIRAVPTEKLVACVARKDPRRAELLRRAKEALDAGA